MGGSVRFEFEQRSGCVMGTGNKKENWARTQGALVAAAQAGERGVLRFVTQTGRLVGEQEHEFGGRDGRHVNSRTPPGGPACGVRVAGDRN